MQTIDEISVLDDGTIRIIFSEPETTVYLGVLEAVKLRHEVGIGLDKLAAEIASAKLPFKK